MDGAVAPRRVIFAGRAPHAAAEQIRCPSCSRLLVLRSGPAITPHFAHRPRQSCRKRPGRAAVRPRRLEQLTLFEVGPELEPPRQPERQPLPALIVDSRPPQERAGRPAPVERRRDVPHRRRRAWLPRLVRWVRRGAARPN